MGCEFSRQTIVKTGEAVLNEFFSKGLIGQMFSALTSPKACIEPTDDERVPQYMKCQFMRGQKEAWETIMLLLVALFFVIGLLAGILYGETKKAIKSFASSENRIINFQMIEAPGSSSNNSSAIPLPPPNSRIIEIPSTDDNSQPRRSHMVEAAKKKLSKAEQWS